MIILTPWCRVLLEKNWFAAPQEIPRISRNPKVHYRTHKRPPTLSILGQPNPVHILTSHLLEIHPLSFMIITCLILLRMRNILDKICRENQNTFFMLNNFLSKILRLYLDNVEKYLETDSPTWQYGACALYAGYLRL